MRILITHERYPPDFGGGGEYVVRHTAESLVRRGHEVQVVTTGDPSMTEHGGVRTQRLPVSRSRFNLQVAPIMRAARQADIVHTFNYHACLPSLLAGRMVGKPVVCEILALFDKTWLAMRGPVRGRAYRAWERFIVTRRFDRSLFLSPPSMRIGIGLGAPTKRCMVLAPGIDRSQMLEPDKGDPVVLFAGRMDVRKGIHHFLAVARALPDIPFAAVGWADDIDAVRQAAPPNVCIHESTGKHLYYEHLARAAVFLFPSYAETYGVAIAEAMASGAAVVSSVDTIDFAGHVVAPGDEAAMIGAVRALWHDRQACAAAGAENMRRAARMSWEAHTDSLEAIYADVLAGRPIPDRLTTAVR
jgi:glycosyltransferase involved in cell wall biosynthesis